MSHVTDPAQAARQEFPGFRGRLIGRDAAEYDEARKVYNGMIDKRPALIAACTDTGEIRRVIAFAREHGLPLAVRGGGHNGAGLGSCDDGVVIDLSLLREITVDPDARMVEVGGGCTWGEVDAVTHAHGLAVPNGIVSTTGVAGLTLGGGHGYLSRKYGLTIDNLLEADVVLADGTAVRASADDNADLFWALRGGGGNFGVVTKFRFRLHPVDIVVGGPTFWPLEQAPEVMRFYREFLPAAPRELYGFFNFHTIPAVDMFPSELHGRKVCGIVWCHLGSPEEAERAFAPALAVGTPLLHGAGELPYPALNTLFDPLMPSGLQWYWKGDFVRELTDEAIECHVEHAARMPTELTGVHMYPIDGAVHDVAPFDTAFAYRDVTWSSVIAGIDPDPANAAALRQWAVDYWEAAHPHSAGGAYVNFMMDEGRSRVEASYRDNYEALARVKATYDPDNAFRINQNIAPAA
jgi:FAD/FMN-containing dehydrogenase